MRTTAHEEHVAAYGVDSCTFTTTTCSSPPPKQPRITRPVLEETTGLVDVLLVFVAAV